MRPHLPLLLLAVLLVLLTACGSSSAPAGTPSPAAATTIRVWYSTDDPAERVWSHQLARRYEASHPDVTVQFSVYSFEDLNTKLELALSAGNPPDAVYVTPRGPGIPVYVANHQLRDLTPYARAGHWAAKLQPGLLARYNGPFSYLGAPRGHIVAVPTTLAAVGVLYNRTLLQKLHLSVPRSPAAFNAALVKAKAAGYTPIGIGNADGWVGDDLYLTLVNAMVPPSALEPEQRLSAQFSFTRPPFLRAANQLRAWASNGYLTPNFGGLDAQEGINLFFRGKTLFQLISSSQNPQITQNEVATGLPIGVFAFPTDRGVRTSPSSGYLGWVIPRAAAHPHAAADFIGSLLTGSTARFLLQHGSIPATRTGALHSDMAWQQTYLDAVRSAQPGIYLDAAPVSNLNATMEANVQLLLQGYEHPSFLVNSLQKVYASHGNGGSTARIDGEF
jgi:raffinose/stachyose/melibiose transport system substrate-binding protein